MTEADLEGKNAEYTTPPKIADLLAWADTVISNGVLNLMPDKDAALREMARVLKPGGRLQIGDILVQKPVPQDAKEVIALWTG